MTTPHIRIAALFIWIGFVCAISFMEAWLKFTAPGVSLAAGLAIGQVVFNTLNKVELMLGSIVMVSLVVDRKKLLEGAFFVALVALIIQTVILLPALSRRIDIYLDGGIPKPSSLHLLYVTLEAIKVIALFFYGFKQINKYETSLINPW